MMSKLLLRGVVLSVMVLSALGCSTNAYWASVAGYEIESQTQETGASDLVLQFDRQVQVGRLPFTINVKNATSGSIEILRTRLALTMDDTLLFLDPLLTGAVSDHLYLSGSTEQVTDASSLVGTPRYQLYDPYLNGPVVGQSRTVSSQTTETSGVINKYGEITMLYPGTIVKLSLRDAYLSYASNILVRAPEDEDDPPTVNFIPNPNYRYSDEDVVILGLPIVQQAMQQIAARKWRLYVAYRVTGSTEIRVASIVFVPGSPRYVRKRLQNWD